jgi:hypothetical protein
MKIDKIIISAFKYDRQWLRICVSSIRYWYPEIPIFIIKDKFEGDFSTTELEKKFDVRTYPVKKDCFGWGIAKIYVLTNEKKGRYLLLDSDTIMAGRIIEKLEKQQEDIIVSGYKSNDPNSRIIKRDYLDFENLKKEFGENFKYLGFGFNTGQLVVKGGRFSIDDFKDFVDFDKCPMQLKYPKLFPYADQGILNYVVSKKVFEKQLSVRYLDGFFLWSDIPFVKNEVSLEKIMDKEGYEGVIHWAGTKRLLLKDNTRYDLLKFFQNYYYSNFRLKKIQYLKDMLEKYFLLLTKIVKKHFK